MPTTRSQTVRAAEQRRATLAHQVWSIGHIREDIIRFYANSFPNSQKSHLFKLLTVNLSTFHDVVKRLYQYSNYCKFPWHCDVPELRMLSYRHAVCFLDVQGCLPACIGKDPLELFDFFPRLDTVFSSNVDMSRPVMNQYGKMETFLTKRQTVWIDDDLELSALDFADDLPIDWDVCFTWELFIDTYSIDRAIAWEGYMESLRDDQGFELPECFTVGDISDLTIDWCENISIWCWLLAKRKHEGHFPIYNISFLKTSIDRHQLQELADVVADSVMTLRLGMDYTDFLDLFPAFDWSKFTELDHLSLTVHCYPSDAFDPVPDAQPFDVTKRCPKLGLLEIEIFVFDPNAEDRVLWDIYDDDNYLEILSPPPAVIGGALASMGPDCAVSVTVDTNPGNADMLDQFCTFYVPLVEQARLASF